MGIELRAKETIVKFDEEEEIQEVRRGQGKGMNGLAVEIKLLGVNRVQQKVKESGRHNQWRRWVEENGR